MRVHRSTYCHPPKGLRLPRKGPTAADLRSVDTSESKLDLKMFHEFLDSGRLQPPLVVARLVYWLVGPWSRTHNGEVFSFRDEAWLAQVDNDLK